FSLEPVDGKEIAGFKPGQYLMFRVNIDGTEYVRCYSLSDAQRPDRYQVTVKDAYANDEIRSVSHYFHGLTAGAVLDVSAPKGQFVFDLHDPTPAVLLAGGVGVTPLLAMVKEVARTGSQREIHLYYGAATPRDFVRPDELRAIAAEYPNIKVHLICSRPDGFAAGVDFDHQGRISLDLLKQTLPKQRYEFYMCGPAGMMSSLTTGLQQHGVSARDIHSEAFAAAPSVVLSKRENAMGVANVQPVQVYFARTGGSLEWDPSSKTLLDVANSKGKKIESGCKAGSCGMCCVDLKSGSVEYPSGSQLDPGAGKILPCIAVPKSDRLELDV
ncbi:MAG TPA: 2Fe-2S iron-sulfur cluster-binding protein, partial [Myxococcota bacterium]|nr:2Fe-2S iron-sulfur cluster-binding protein [Myxococcota bacterium]